MIRIAFLVAAAMIAFAANSVFARLALGSGAIDAAGYSGIRLLAGAVTLAILVVASGRKLAIGAAARHRTRWTTAIALLVYAVAFSYSYRLVGAGTGALILFATVQIAMLSWGLVKGDRPGAVALLGMAIALGAFAYLVSPGLVAPSPLGAALMIAAGLAWAVYSLLGRGSTQPLIDTAQNFVLLAPVSLLLGAASLITAPPSVAGIGWAIASGALASGVGYATWYSVLPSLTRSRAAIVQLSVPAIAAAGGIAFIGEALTPRLMISSLLILGGVAMAVAGRPARPSGRPSST